MQKQWSIAGCLALVALTSTGVNYWQIGQINSFRLQEKISQAENRLLKDQINELEFKITTTRTYDEGLMDGLYRKNNQGYVDGYHAAISQAEDEKYYQQLQKENKNRIAEEKKQKTIDDKSKVSVPTTSINPK